MTRQEIKTLIDNRRALHGKLTREDFFDIGMAHRQLPKIERSWSWLLSLTGGLEDGFQTSEGYRNFIVKRLRKSGQFENHCGESHVEDDYTQQKQEIYKERQLLRDERTALNALLRDQARVERFKEELFEEARKLKDLPAIKYDSKESKCKGEAVALLSDIHLGMQIDELCNTYNLDIAIKRVDKWTNDVIKYCKANSVKRLNIINLGDMIAGEIHPSIRIMQECDVAEQVMKAGEILARALNKLQSCAPEVYYRSVSDNHSRFMPDLHQSIERENFFRLIDWWLEARLGKTKIKMPKDNVNFRTGKFRLMNGKLCMFEHGHQIKPNQTFQDLIGLVEEYVHYVFLGHYHSEKMKTFQNMRVYINGSVCGTDPYADSIHKYTKPKQTLLIFDGDNVLNFSIDLDIRK